MTLTWYRFLGSACCIVLLTGPRLFTQAREALRTTPPSVILVAGTGLTANYVLYLAGLRFLTPPVAQVVMQVTPFFVVGGGILLFHESFSRRQAFGVALLVVGCICFFNLRWSEFRTLDSEFSLGVGLILLAGLTWAFYLLAQKVLVRTMSSRTIMFFCYATGVIVLPIGVEHEQVWALRGHMIWLLLLSILITFSSYIAFASALRRIDATTAGLAIANIPLVTIIGTFIIGPWVERIPVEPLNTVGVIGSVLVVAGSMIGAAENKEPRQARS